MAESNFFILSSIAFFVSVFAYKLSEDRILPFFSSVALKIVAIHSFLMFFIGPISSFFYANISTVDNQDFNKKDLFNYSESILIGVIWTILFIVFFWVLNYLFYALFSSSIHFKKFKKSDYIQEIFNNIDKKINFFFIFSILTFTLIIKVKSFLTGCSSSLSAFLNLDCQPSLLLSLSNLIYPTILNISCFLISARKTKLNQYILLFLILINLLFLQLYGDRRSLEVLIIPYLAGSYIFDKFSWKNNSIIFIASFFILSLVSPYSELLGGSIYGGEEINYFSLFFEALGKYFSNIFYYLKKTFFEIGYSFDYTYINNAAIKLRQFVTRDINCYPLIYSLNSVISRIFDVGVNFSVSTCNAEYLLFKQALVTSGEKPYLVNPGFAENITFGGYSLLIFDSIIRGVFSAIFFYLFSLSNKPYSYLILISLISDMTLYFNSWHKLTYFLLIKFVMSFCIAKIIFLRFK